MKAIWNSSSYGNDLRLTRSDAELMSHQGRCDDDVDFCMRKPYIAKQLAKLDSDPLREELAQYGAWDCDELNDHQENLKRWLWISAGDIVERN